MKILMVKTLNNSLKCAFDVDIEQFKKVKANDIVEVEIIKKRNPLFHAKFFALINLVYQNQEKINNLEHLRKELIICSGHYDLVFDLETGEQKKEAQSMKFSSMDEVEFNQLYNDIIQVIVDKFKWKSDEIKEAVNLEIEKHF
jgi:hypothetical protein